MLGFLQNKLASKRPQLRAIVFYAFLCLTLVQSFNSYAVENGCKLYVADLTKENRDLWSQKGYHLVEQKDLLALTPKALATLLNNSSFAVRRSSKQEFLISLNNGAFTETWEPLSVQAPALGADISDAYACGVMKSRLDFFRTSRQAVVDVYNIISDQAIARTRGEAILDLERSFYVHKAHTIYEQRDPKKKYLDLLSRVKTFNRPATDFFKNWANVREQVYGATKMNLEYCTEFFSMTSSLLEKCVNCVGETYLIMALYEDAGFKAPSGWAFGAQAFNDHLRPVLYNVETKKTYDLVSGAFGNFKASIFNIEAVYAGLWRGHGALRFDKEKTFIDQFPVNYVYQSPWCLIPEREGRPDMRPSEFSQIRSCENFSKSPGEPPKNADNESKAGQNSFDEDDANGGWPFGEGGPPHAGESNSGQGGPGGGLTDIFDAIKGWFNRSDGEKDFFRSEFGYTMAMVAENLIPEEREAILESLKNLKFGPELIPYFSIHKMLSGWGFGHYKFLSEYKLEPDPQHWDWDTLILPLYIRTTAEDLTLDTRRDDYLARLDGERDLSVSRCADVAVLCVYVGDTELFTTLKPQSTIERYKTISAYIKKRNSDAALALSGQLQLTDVNFAGDIAKLNTLDKNILRAYSSSLEFMRSWPRMIVSGVKPPNISMIYYKPSDGANPLTDALLDLSGVNEIEKTLRPYYQIAQLFDEHPVEAIRFIDQDYNHGMALQQVMAQISDIIFLAEKQFAKLPARPDLPILNRVTLKAGIGGQLLVNLLTHPKYFFTVEPEKEEIPPLRPYYPKTIRDPEVRDEKKVQNDLPRPVIHPPVWNTESDVCANSNGYQLLNGGAIVIDCGSDNPSGAPKIGKDEIDQTGIKDGNVNGVAQGNKQGSGQLSQAGQINDESAGQDQDGTLVLAKPLSSIENQYPASKLVDKIRPSEMTATPEQAYSYDPREEVHISPDTWLAMLWDNSMGGAELTTETPIKILLHHVLRKKLYFQFSSMEQMIGFNRFTAADLDLGIRSFALEDWQALGEKYFEVTRLSATEEEFYQLADEILRKPVNISFYAGLENQTFMQVALEELKTSPKPGTVFLTSGVIETYRETLRYLDILYPPSNMSLILGEPISIPLLGNSGSAFDGEICKMDSTDDMIRRCGSDSAKGAMHSLRGQGFDTVFNIDEPFRTDYRGLYYGTPRVAVYAAGNNKNLVDSKILFLHFQELKSKEAWTRSSFCI